MLASKIPPSNFKPFGFDTQRFTAVGTTGQTLQTMLDPEYWSHVVARVRPGCIIEAHAEDGSWYAELYVRAVGTREMRVAVLRHIEFDQAIDAVLKEETNSYVVAWKGPVNRYGVCMPDGKTAIRTGFATKEDAYTWMVQHKKTMAA